MLFICLFFISKISSGIIFSLTENYLLLFFLAQVYCNEFSVLVCNIFDFPLFIWMYISGYVSLG